MGDKQRGPGCFRKGPEVNTTTPKEHHPDLAESDVRGRNGAIFLGAGGRMQDALLFANENLSLSSQLQRPEPGGRVA